MVDTERNLHIFIYCQQNQQTEKYSKQCKPTTNQEHSGSELQKSLWDNSFMKCELITMISISKI